MTDLQTQDNRNENRGCEKSLGFLQKTTKCGTKQLSLESQNGLFHTPYFGIAEGEGIVRRDENKMEEKIKYAYPECTKNGVGSIINIASLTEGQCADKRINVTLWKRQK